MSLFNRHLLKIYLSLLTKCETAAGKGPKTCVDKLDKIRHCFFFDESYRQRKFMEVGGIYTIASQRLKLD